MKKMLVLALALVFMLSGAVMAQYTGTFDDHFDVDLSQEYIGGDGGFDEIADYAGYTNEDFDGLVFYNDVDPENPGDYTNLEFMNRTGYYDVNGTNDDNRQRVEITLPVEAYIPCFLEMRLTGNQGTTSAISYGPGAQGGTTATGYLMVFDNELGGYLDENWQSLGYGSNVAENPGENLFIGACDIFAVEVISNDNYRYEVSSEALEGQGGAAGHTLPMYMRTDLGGGWLANDFIFNAPQTFARERNAGVKLEALHNFKVPFGMNTVHGEYNGEVVFRALTI
jgi:hypothetical protein